MAMRSISSLQEESLYKKGGEKEVYKYAILLIQTYDESYIRKERDSILGKIQLLKDRIDEKDYNGTKEAINSEINRLKGKLKTFNLILY